MPVGLFFGIQFGCSYILSAHDGIHITLILCFLKTYNNNIV